MREGGPGEKEISKRVKEKKKIEAERLFLCEISR